MNSPRLITAGYAREMTMFPSSRKHPIEVTVRHFIPGDVITDAEQEKLTVDIPLATEAVAIEDAYWRLHRQAKRDTFFSARNSTAFMENRIRAHLAWLLRCTPKGDGRDTVRIRHDDLAQDLATTREGVTRELMFLRTARLINTGYRYITFKKGFSESESRRH